MINKQKSFHILSKTFHFVFLLSFILVLTSCTKESYPDNNIEKFSHYLDQRIVRLMNRYEIPGVSVAIIQDNEIVWENAYGYSNVEAKRKMTINTICRTESISKSVTAWGIMKLVKENKIVLDSPVQDYLKSWELPVSNYNEEEVTIRKLLSHSSGLDYGSFTHYGLDEEIPTLIESLNQEAKIIFEPGSTFFYSNVGYHILELLIEEVTNQSFENYITNEILLPLGMSNSKYIWENNEVLGYDSFGNSVSPYLYPANSSGGLLSNVTDIAKFVIGGMNNQQVYPVLSKENIQELYQPVTKTKGIYGLVSEAYGLGYFIDYLDNGKISIFSGGQGHGWMSQLHFLPDEGKGIVILTNSQRSWPFFSYIMNEWSNWSNGAEIGMGILVNSIPIVILLIGLLFLASLYLISIVGIGLKKAKRCFNPFSKRELYFRLILFIGSTIIFSVLIYCLNLDYLEIVSLYPLLYKWIGFGLFLFALALLLLVLFPKGVFKNKVKGTKV